MSGKYDDLLHLPHPTSAKHPRMPLHDRAAQFAPFAALTGYGDTLLETARRTDSQLVPSEEEQAALDAKLRFLLDCIGQRPEVAVTYFVPDGSKPGGEYITRTGALRRIDEARRRLVFAGGDAVEIDRIADMQCALFGNLFD